jgi:HlyD family secretion protein
MATLEIQRREADGVIEKADLQLQIAQLELERYEKGELPNELRKLRLAKEKATSEWNRAEEKFLLIPALAEEGFFTAAEVEEEEIKVREAKLAAETADLDLKLYEEYSQKITFKQKNAAEREAQRGLENARKKTEISMKEKEANIARQEGQLEASRSRLEKLTTDMEKMTMKAPQAGIVHYGDAGSPWSRDRIKIGNQVYRGSTIITLPDLTEMEVLTKVHEADVGKVDLEQAVTITLDTYPGRIFTGKVTHIASVATSSGWDENTKAFRITVAMDTTEVELRAGISAKVEIEVAMLENVLHIPIHSVFAEEGEHFCFVATGEVSKRTVTVGQNNAHYVVILAGLTEGEKVLLYDPRDREAPADSAADALEAEDPAPGSDSGIAE